MFPNLQPIQVYLQSLPTTFVGRFRNLCVTVLVLNFFLAAFDATHPLWNLPYCVTDTFREATDLPQGVWVTERHTAPHVPGIYGVLRLEDDGTARFYYVSSDHLPMDFHGGRSWLNPQVYGPGGDVWRGTYELENHRLVGSTYEVTPYVTTAVTMTIAGPDAWHVLFARTHVQEKGTPTYTSRETVRRFPVEMCPFSR
jgi:hypothetical protein